MDDVLFATRALMADDTRDIGGGYTLVSYDAHQLVITPQIDNYST